MNKLGCRPTGLSPRLWREVGHTATARGDPEDPAQTGAAQLAPRRTLEPLDPRDSRGGCTTLSAQCGVSMWEEEKVLETDVLMGAQKCERT